MKYSAKEEQELMADLWSPALRDNPLAFVQYVYPWGVEGTPLEHHKSPRKWQMKVLEEMATHIARNRGQLDPEMLRTAVASGRGIGKSALVGWLVHWMLSTRLGSTVIVTANTDQQLRSRTWPEIGKWMTLSINSHWFDVEVPGATHIAIGSARTWIDLNADFGEEGDAWGVQGRFRGMVYLPHSGDFFMYVSIDNEPFVPYMRFAAM